MGRPRLYLCWEVGGRERWQLKSVRKLMKRGEKVAKATRRRLSKTLRLSLSVVALLERRLTPLRLDPQKRRLAMNPANLHSPASSSYGSPPASLYFPESPMAQRLSQGSLPSSSPGAIEIADKVRARLISPTNGPADRAPPTVLPSLPVRATHAQL